jgi:CDP-4-dehydro-6-deoxyglucose reductase, E3
VAAVELDGKKVTLEAGEKVLNGLLRAGIPVAHSCHVGACQSCLLKAVKGEPPRAAQIGLKSTLRAQGYFLPCLAVPEEDLVLARPAEGLETEATITNVEKLAGDVIRVHVTPRAAFRHEAGQFVNLIRADGLARSYSIASLPDEGLLELHVRLLPGGRMSQWLASEAALGAPVRLRGPTGECFYVPGKEDEPLVLAGTGTGLAPLWGVARQALRSGHRGPISLFHGARTAAGLYLVEELAALSAAHGQFSYQPILTELDAEVFARFPSLEGTRVFLCGDPTLVTKMRRRAFLAGADLSSIHADAFVTAAATTADSAPSGSAPAAGSAA